MSIEPPVSMRRRQARSAARLSNETTLSGSREPFGAIGLDLGTSGVRGVLIDRQGRLCCESRMSVTRSTMTASPTPDRSDQTRSQGEHEHEATALERAALSVLGHLLDFAAAELLGLSAESHTTRTTSKRQQRIALAIAGTSGSLLLADEGPPFTARTTCRLYDDTRSAQAAACLQRQAPQIGAAGGLGASAPRWLELVRATALSPPRSVPMHPADWLTQRWLTPRRDANGEYLRVSDANNALKLGFDPETMHWPADLPHTLARAFHTLVNEPLSVSTVGETPKSPTHPGTRDEVNFEAVRHDFTKLETPPKHRATHPRLPAIPETAWRQALPQQVVAPGQFLGGADPTFIREHSACTDWSTAAREALVCIDIHAGTTDATAAFVASLPNDSNDTVGVTSLGSTLVLKQLSPIRIEDPATGVYSHRLDDRWIVSGASNSGGAALARLFTPAQIDRLSAHIDLDRLPTPDVRPLAGRGERFPNPNPNAEPIDPPLDQTDVDRLHDMLAAIARVEHAGYARFALLGAPRIDRVVTNGLGAGNRTWQRLRSRILGRPCEPTPAPPVRPGCKSEPSTGLEAAIGAARLALHGGRLPSIR